MFTLPVLPSKILKVAEFSDFEYGEEVGLSDSQETEIYENTLVLYENMDTMYTQILATKDTADDIEVFLTDTVDPKLDTILDFLVREFLDGIKNSGCDGIDQDNDDVADNCEEVRTQM